MYAWTNCGQKKWTKNSETFLPPDSIATRMTPHDQTSAAVAWYGRTKISGATYGNVPQRLSNNRSLPFILNWEKKNEEKKRKKKSKFCCHHFI